MKSKITSILNQAINNRLFPGACLAVISAKQKQVYCVGSLGIKEVDQSPVNENTLYDLASLTKVISTTPLILKLIDDHQLSLDTCVDSILPQFKHQNITIEHLLTHTSGLIADDPLKHSLDKQSLIQRIYTNPLDYPTSTKVVYSDLGFILLGQIIEAITHKPLQEVASEFFSSLDMTHTSYLPQDTTNCAYTQFDASSNSYFHGIPSDSKARLLDNVAGHAGVFSTIHDLCNYVSMMLNDGIYNDKQILSHTMIEHLKHNYTKGLNNSRTLGYIIKDVQSPFPLQCGTQSIFHTGFTGTSIFIDFEHQFAFILLTNRVHPKVNDDIIKWRYSFNQYIWDAYHN